MHDFNIKWILYLFPLTAAIAAYIRHSRTQRADIIHARQFHCQPLKTLPYRWPLALDLLWQAYHHATQGRILRFMTMLIAPLPPTFEQKILGLSGIDTVDPQNIEAILSTHFTSFGMGDRPDVWKPFIGPGIFTQDGDEWKHSRELLRPLFMSKRLDNFLEVQESAEALIKCIPPGKFIDFQPLMFRFTLDTTTYLLFGRSIRSLAEENPEAEAFGEAFRISQEYLSHRGRLGPLHWMMNPKRFRNANAIVHTWIDREIQKALKAYQSGSKENMSGEKSTDYGFLGPLVEESRDPKFLRDAMLNVLLAGRDTTGCLLTWTMRLLVMHRRAMDKLREEIDRTLGVGTDARCPDRNDMKKMSYLSYVLKEVLRMYPSAPINSRAAVKSLILPTGGGPDGTAPVFVKKGTPVGYFVYGMHRRAELYGSDAGEFRPERWDPNEATNEVDLRDIGWGYLPFNGGPRVCPGQEFAILESSYLIIRLLQEFSGFEGDPNAARQMAAVGEEKQDVTLVLASGDGCWIRAQRSV